MFHFSSRTRMLFACLLALIKWASTAGKVEKCSNIVMFLGKQSNMFMETANQLAIMARETCQSHAAQLLGNLGIYSKTSQLSNGEDNSEVFNGRDNSEGSEGLDNSAITNHSGGEADDTADVIPAGQHQHPDADEEHYRGGPSPSRPSWSSRVGCTRTSR